MVSETPFTLKLRTFKYFHISAETSASAWWISKNWLATEIMFNFASVVSCQNILIKLRNKNERWFFVGENVQVVLSLADGVENGWWIVFMDYWMRSWGQWKWQNKLRWWGRGGHCVRRCIFRSDRKYRIKRREKRKKKKETFHALHKRLQSLHVPCEQKVFNEPLSLRLKCLIGSDLNWSV